MMTDYTKLSDADLAAATVGGDTEAFSEIVSRYKNYIFSVVRQTVRNAADAEDIVQETFIDGWRGLASLHEKEKLKSWLYGIALRKSLKFAARTRYHEDVDVFEVPDNSLVEDKYLAAEKKETVLRAIASLSEKNRIVCGLFYLKRMTVAEISYRLGLPEGTVKSRLYEARAKLREELKAMEENISLDSEFNKKIIEKISQIKNYYSKQGESWDGFEEQYAEAKKSVEALPQSSERDYALADLLYQNYMRSDDNPELKQQALDAAYKSGNGEVLTNILVDDAFACQGDMNAWLDVIDSRGIPELQKLGYVSGEGVMRFWRGYGLYKLKRYDECYAELKRAVDMIDRSDVYHACAVTAVRNIELMREYGDDPNSHLNAMSETYECIGSRVIMTSEPGFGGSDFSDRHRLDALGYYCTRYNRNFFDTSLAVGETRTSKDGGTFTVISYDEPLTVPAGDFKQTMHVRYSEENYIADVWYAMNVGLLKAEFSGDWAWREGEKYELTEYEIKGGEGYYPFALGNRWRYENPFLPDCLFYRHEVEVDWISPDSSTVNVTYLLASFFKKDYKLLFKLDSETHMDEAARLSDDWKVHEAVSELKEAVRANTNQEATTLALSWIPVMERFAEYHDKGYRFCPGSMGDNILNVTDGIIKTTVGNWSIGPYRFGTRGAENRIFGVKPMRYLEQLAGAAWSDEWKPEYTGTRTYEGVDVTLRVDDGGSITVPVGTFDGCVKLTVTVEKPDDRPDYYFAENYRYMFCGTKTYWYTPGVGIVRHDCEWGNQLDSSCVLVKYSLPAGDGSMFPVQIGNSWEYDEIHLTAENYRAKFNMGIVCGMGERYIASTSQEFIWLGTEEEYETWKKENNKT